ncbi:MAG: response regulator [Paludibacter sp.]|nr:response regulator [Paludibacter sp.]MDD4198333.1 response regulator [Paludibacter sp.]MDD4428074.1 response regulator [Paludibacter sp.]
MDKLTHQHIPANVLIVDDIEENLIYIESVIKNFNINIISALSGYEALEKTCGMTLAMAIIDVWMPGMNGYELAVKINDERRENKVPIIFITANIFSEIEELKGYDAGAVDYIYKPFSSQILKSKVSIFLDLYHQKQTILTDAILLRNTTEQLKEANLALQKSEQKFRSMVNASPDGVIFIDLKGRIREISDIGTELLGANSKEELLGMHILRFISPGSLKTIKDIAQNTISEGLTQDVELNLVKLNGTHFLAEISTTLIQNSDGSPLSYNTVVRDISQRKKMQAIQIHADRMANLGQMAAGMAHEINQPLNIISMVMDKILFDAEKMDFIDVPYMKNKSSKIFENLTRIRNIIDHIRVFSRNQFEYIPIAFNINKSIENAVSMIMEQFKHLGISLDTYLSDDIPDVVGNTYQFEQVIINLLTNAKDAVMEKKMLGDESYIPHISINTFVNLNMLIAEITDNGTGINDEIINNIMLPFFSTKEEGKGTGLGLSISYQIIKDMGGIIEVVSSKMTMTKIRLVFNINNTQHGRKR